MTDRLEGFTVVFDTLLRDDDAEGILDAVRLLPHIIKVEPLVAGVETHFAEERAKHNLKMAIYEILK